MSAKQDSNSMMLETA
jgi:hypothetical protein